MSAESSTASRADDEPSAPLDHAGGASALTAPIPASDSQTDPDDVLNRTRKRWWWQRPTIRSIKKDQRRHRSYRDKFDEKWNAETRLPTGEAVHIGGITVVEAFTPSTVSALHETLRRWPQPKSKTDGSWVEQLENGRAHGGSWMSLGYIRKPGDFMLGDHHDASLPKHVQAVWLQLAFIVPSVAIVCATFTFDESQADLSEVLRADYQTVTTRVGVEVKGRFGSIRSRWPWSRPRGLSVWSQPVDALIGKRRAVDAKVEELAQPCRDWFYAKFRGRFSVEPPIRQPEAVFLFTEEATPFAERGRWQDSVGLAWSTGVYRSTDRPGWSLKVDPFPSRRRPWLMTVAAKRSDVGDEDVQDRRGQSNWSLTQRFNDEQTTLIARLSLRALLDLYSRRLARLRDDAGTRQRFRRPVRDARRLDTFLLTDGLDAATVAPDVIGLTSDQVSFRWNVPEYDEDLTPLQPGGRNLEPSKLVPDLADGLRRQAERLGADAAATDANLRASAELRQAVANTRLQRTVVLVSIAALVVALISLLH
jgi:hypothetical protein